ncbi:zinc-binding dehydrogenase [Priestia megaterium]|uniref:zinc-binding dehydrogenase n=1 Tax=Priestia megaterium TaxID=1404 RepID=UPI002E210377|nr:zinc-binding dehydrogenase [Priestia megaterium]MED4268371.1 zinc-binding dehydrogenase [Priestia megaterium]MED4279268.1 zinc-binding dehydrogenase [Priestia megaterium]MED4314658.1 zinc-binding dehydrogenase [Priestia megaterium]
MKALVHEGTAGINGLSLRKMEDLEPKSEEVIVRLKTAGLNHRDLFTLDRHKPADPPLIIGSDGAGIVEAVGENVLNIHVGDEVIINPGIGWEDKTNAPPQDFTILGHPFNGTFAEQVIIPAKNTAKKPKHLSWEEAGVLSLSALTAYRAMFTRAKIKPEMKVLIPGIGSGVATFLLQFAKAVGATVYVTSRSEEKCKKAIDLGANKAIDSNEDWDKALDGEKMDLVIESVGAATFTKSLNQVIPGGTVVTFGASAGDVTQINLRTFFYGQLNLLGSTMGSNEEFLEMVKFVETYKIKPIVDRMYPLSEFKQAFRRIESSAQLGKVGLII